MAGSSGANAARRAGGEIRRMREAKGFSQQDLARAVGLSVDRIGALEGADAGEGPSYEVLQRIATACGYEIAFLDQATTLAAEARDKAAVSPVAEVFFAASPVGAALAATTVEVTAAPGGPLPDIDLSNAAVPPPEAGGVTLLPGKAETGGATFSVAGRAPIETPLHDLSGGVPPTDDLVKIEPGGGEAAARAIERPQPRKQ